MKTSLLILCAAFAIAASTSVFDSTFQFRWVSTKEVTSINIVRCREEVELQFVIFPGKGVLIEKSSACTIIDPTAKLGQQGGGSMISVNADRNNGYHALNLKCQDFAVIVPGSHVQKSKISDTIVECIPAEYHDWFNGEINFFYALNCSLIRSYLCVY